MGKQAIHVSGVLWQQICTVGWKGAFECTEGLPEGATLCGVSHKRYGIQDEFLSGGAQRPEGANVVIFTFEHPDWPELVPGAEIPIISVVHEKTHEEPSCKWS